MIMFLIYFPNRIKTNIVWHANDIETIFPRCSGASNTIQMRPANTDWEYSKGI